LSSNQRDFFRTGSRPSLPYASRFLGTYLVESFDRFRYDLEAVEDLEGSGALLANELAGFIRADEHDLGDVLLTHSGKDPGKDSMVLSLPTQSKRVMPGSIW
jgi:hypothetical protein